MNNNTSKLVLIILSLITVTVWLSFVTFPEPELKLIACDVGQGDAILATYGSTQILVDGGPNNSVIDCLSENIPFWDRVIELVVLTHPQTDHFKGLIEVFERYSVEIFLTNSLDSGSQSYQVLKNVVGGSGTKVIQPDSGMSIRLGLLYLDIVHPSKSFVAENTTLKSEDLTSNVLGAFDTKRNINDFSIVAILRLGEFDALLTGDIGPEVMDEVISQLVLRGSRRMEYLKVPHHGSKNGLTQELLEITKPEVAVISAGANNRYDHPHEEVLKLLKDQDIRILRTDTTGDVVIMSEGK